MEAGLWECYKSPLPTELQRPLSVSLKAPVGNSQPELGEG